MIDQPQTLSHFETLTPADTAAVAEAVREAAREGRAVFPRGGGTSWCFGVKPAMNNSPRPLGEGPGVRAEAEDITTFNSPHPNPLPEGEGTSIILSLEKMNRLVDHAAEDMTVTVEAGMTFAELEKILAAKNQRLPIDVREPEKATLGGLVAVNEAGPRQFAYGTLRDYLIGFTAVDGEGTIFHGGGRVVKNAAGYNMTRLMTGSFGTLGILTQLSFMVRPMPEFMALVPCILPDLETAEKLLADLNQSQVRPVVVELESGLKTKVSRSEPKTSLASAVKKPSGETSRHISPATVLYVGFEGTEAEVHWMVDTLSAEWSVKGVDVQQFLVASADAPGNDATISKHRNHEIEWRWLADVPADVRIAVRPSQVVAFLAAVREKYPDCSIQSHALSGIVLVASEWGRAEGASYYRELRSLAESFGGKMTVLDYPDSVELSREDIWGPPPEGFRVMRSLKERFDPQNILNPGRFIFE